MDSVYELVLRFSLAPRDIARYDRVTEFEARLPDGGDLYTLDGHDCGCGRIDVLLITGDPERAFHALREMIPACCPYDAGYRTAHSEEALTALSV